MNPMQELAARLALAILTLLASASPALADENPAPSDPSLLPVFEQFGGKPGIDALMEDFMVKLIEDPRTRNYFAEADQTHIKAMLAEQFCVILGGPCTYTGKGMREAHAKLVINQGGFNALVEDLQRAMDMHDIPFRAQNRLLAVLAPMHREVITEP
ncbi:group I truncated hemoglobin [Dokdonella immobilis]|uniref:Hemoglobin n=1 Tax=Dokdonella immobilis TaxID=578942 RepID=A0A1I4WWZ2_9GAMM|nr:group 1 truncated hemoglobin [Dokdonella immobilis]SFN18027.1 hemoglobin [Dokdonella immobilis]